MTGLRYLVTIVLVLFACTTSIDAQALKWTDVLAPAGKFDNDPKNFNILTTLVDYAGLRKAALGLRSSTVFVPADEAFINILNKFTSFKGRNESLAFEAIKREAESVTGTGLKGPALANAVLLYHIVPYPMTKNHIVTNSYFAPTLLKGKTILLTKSTELVDGNPFVLNPVVIKADIRVENNNILHIINGLLIPDIRRP